MNKKRAAFSLFLASIAGFAVFLAGTATGGADAAGSSSKRAPRGRCERLGETLLETQRVRIFSRKTSRPDVAGSAVFGCLRPGGKPVLFNRPPQGTGDRTAVNPDALATRGKLVAFSQSVYGTDTVSNEVRVLNLGKSGSLLRTCFAGSARAPSSGPEIAKIVLKGNGSVAWSAEGQPRSGRGAKTVNACDTTGQRVLETAGDIDLTSLKLEGSVVRWLSGGGWSEGTLE